MEFRTLIIALEVLAALLAFGLAGVVARSATSRQRGRLLAGLLVTEGLLQAFAGASDIQDWFFLGLITTLGLLLWLYLRLLSTLPTPLARWLRPRAFHITSGVVLIGAPLACAATALAVLVRGGDVETFFNENPLGLVFPFLFLTAAVASLLGPVLALSAWRRAERGSPSRAQAAAFAIAFIARDLLLLLSIVLSEALVDKFDEPLHTLLDQAGEAMLPLMVLVYVPLLAYGILRTQLFDLDLRVKVGIERSTLLTIVAIGVLVTQRVVERYATAAYGWLAAVIVAVGMLLLKSKLDKVAATVANTAMPQVQPTPAYVQFKKLEVYKAAVESANEVGMDDKQRRMLDKLAAKLALAPEDRAAVEAEVTRA